eukprot:CAMPEP_0171345252 /NCGR_PEP_ID=MMETSP0878-20121228/21081_1 /TAXON_ID=67004 /ORGANISM="Thalassiosira weissflogii, Strain CCMP1336" /LENGTH=301 /DNA_ID=CAMNT_0011848615 /DNA_START=13 /DNA_END=918 /DNA_ORIENTATION=-
MASTRRVVISAIVAGFLSLSSTVALLLPNSSTTTNKSLIHRQLGQEKLRGNQLFGSSRNFRILDTEVSEYDTIAESESNEFPNIIVDRDQFTALENEPKAAGNHVEIYLSLSPLIGGPPFLPVHIEVILTAHIRKNHDRSEWNHGGKAAKELHRFDFLPASPTDPMTLLRLMTLRPVAGKVRHRIFYQEDRTRNNEITVENENRLALCNNFSFRNQKGRGVVVSLPIGSVTSQQHAVKHQSTVMEKSTRCNEIIANAIDFTNKYKLTCGKELRLLGGKNCVSFAVDLLMHLDSMHGVNFKL